MDSSANIKMKFNDFHKLLWATIKKQANVHDDNCLIVITETDIKEVAGKIFDKYYFRKRPLDYHQHAMAAIERLTGEQLSKDDL